MELRVLSYNIHRAIGVDRRFLLRRIAEILAHHNADILLLQEVDVGVPRSRRLNLASELAEQLEYPYCAVGLNVKLRTGMYGNATLSRFPILEKRNIDLTIGTRKARGCLFTKMELLSSNDQKQGLELALFNLHLGLAGKERVQQLELVIRSPEFGELSSMNPCMVAGDFNDWRTRLPTSLKENHGFACANEHSSKKAMRATYPSFAPTLALDKIFYRGRMRVLASRRCRLRVSKVASDHLPVLVDFDISEVQTSA